MKRILILTFVLLTAFGVKASAQSLKPNDELAVMKICQKFATLQDDGNLNGYLDLYTENAVVSNPFGTFTGKDQIKTFTTGYINGFAKGKRHMLTNILVDGNGRKATAVWDMFVMEVKEIPMIVATVRNTAELEKTAAGWKFTRYKGSIDDGFSKVQEKMKKMENQ